MAVLPDRSKLDSHLLRHFFECISFQTSEAVGFPIQESPFPGRPHDRACEARSDAPLLCVPEITTGASGRGSLSLILVLVVEVKEGVAFDQVQVEETAGGDDGADFEFAGDLLKCVLLIPDGRPIGPQLIAGH